MILSLDQQGAHGISVEGDHGAAGAGGASNPLLEHFKVSLNIAPFPHKSNSTPPTTSQKQHIWWPFSPSLFLLFPTEYLVLSGRFGALG